MNPQTTETPKTETKPQEQEAPRLWVTPVFERVPLNEALSGPTPNLDGIGWS